MEEDPLSPWLALYHIPTLTTKLTHEVLRVFGAPAAVLGAEDHELLAAGVPSPVVHDLRYWHRNDSLVRLVHESLAWCQAAEQHVITLADARYPPLLREIDDPPLLLFVRGNPAALLLPQIAIVGSRKCSIDGREIAAAFSADLASRGFSICSGLAIGIDTAAHAAAVRAEATTVAILGTGVDIVYPSGNVQLADRIRQTGALASELPLSSPPRADHFPRRNRIISGMSLGVIVIEAAARSGSLITARMAMEQNREVFAVPGSIRNSLSKGTHQLIRDGVTLVEDPAHVLEHLDCLLAAQHGRLAGLAVAAQSPRDDLPVQHPYGLSPEESAVLKAIGYDPVCVDTLVERTGLPVHRVHPALLVLELNGSICCDSGRYRIV